MVMPSPSAAHEKLVAALSPSLRALALRGTFRNYRKNTVIITEGEIGDSLFLIGRGVVRVFVGGRGVPEVTMDTLHTGDFFGEMAIVSGNPRSASVAAVTHCSLYELRRGDLEAVQIVCPALQQVLEATARDRAAR